MYNRYIPQPDGSYRRNPVTEPPRPKPPEPVYPPEPPCPPEPRPDCQECPPPCPQEPPCSPPPNHSGNAGDFLKRLLPKNLDTGDLFVIILLLLMAGDDQNSSTTALLTLALYLFL